METETQEVQEQALSGDEMMDQVIKDLSPEAPTGDKTPVEKTETIESPEDKETEKAEEVEKEEVKQEQEAPEQEEAVPEIYKGKSFAEMVKIAEDLKRGYTEQNQKAKTAERLIEEIMNYQPGAAPVADATDGEETITLEDIPMMRRQIDAMYRSGDPEQVVEAGRQQNLLAIKETELREAARAETARKFQNESVISREEAWIEQNIMGNTRIPAEKKAAFMNAMGKEILSTPEWRKIPNYMNRLFQDVIESNPDLVVKPKVKPKAGDTVVTPSFSPQAETESQEGLTAEDEFFMKKMGVSTEKAIKTYKNLKKKTSRR